MMHSPTIRPAFAFLFISSFIISVNESCTKSGLTDRATSSVKPRTVGSSQFAISSVDLDRVRIFAHFLVDPRPREPSRARVNMLGDREEWGCSCNQQMSHCMLMKSDTVMSSHSLHLARSSFNPAAVNPVIFTYAGNVTVGGHAVVEPGFQTWVFLLPRQ